MTAVRRAIALALSFGLVGCPKEEAFDPASDRTLQKLKAEQERIAKGGTPSGPPGAKVPQPDPLAQAAAAQEPPRALALPPGATAKAGALQLELRRVEVSQTVQTPRAAISTAERFVRVLLTATATAKTPLKPGDAELVLGERKAGITRDVQRLGQGSPLDTAIEPGVEQDLVLYFEVEAAMIAPGLKIILPVGEKAVELPVQ